MQALPDIFGIWPSLQDMAKEIDEKYDTVYRWQLKGRIPETAWAIIIEKAARRERLVTIAELHGANRPPKQRGQPAHRERVAG